MSLIGTPSTASTATEHANAFADLLFGHLPRADQRGWARTYLRGLLWTHGKKSVRRLAEAVSASPRAWYSLQQFISGSSWEWSPSRAELARWVEHRASVRAWTVAPVVTPKRGAQSVGVHRRFVPSAGRILNCQVGTALFLSCPGANFPVDWKLHLPAEWVADEPRRRCARIPDSVRVQPLWKDALDLVSGMAGASSAPAVPVVADMSDADDVGRFVAGLEALGRDFVVAVPPTLRVNPVGAPGAPRTPGTPNLRPAGLPAPTADSLLNVYGNRHCYTATVNGTGGQFRRTRVAYALVQLPAHPRRPQESYRLFTEVGANGRRAAPVWLTNLTHRRLEELLELSLLHVSATATLTCLDDRFELLDFAGRSYPGWHHHMTLASAAYAYARLAQPGDLPAPVLAERRESVRSTA